MFFNAELVQVITLGKARFNKNFDYELIRFCTKKDIAVIGGFSKLLNYFKSNYGNSIITYADKRYSNGNVYLKNHFEFIRETNPNYFYTKDHVNLMNRLKFQKHKLEKQLENFNNDLSEWENMKQNGYDRIWDCGNLVFSLK